ncbi:tetratricopeptide repeat-containing sensor histidine kinase [Pedobacter nanyangensis]|uniref:tetratricopeptide repeat-containing sensor histidine kinase n=1 Tax=Pedobacter nanyangensis TaxID=1562389 RepID=UPI0013B3B34E|nr:tetratricopeptide repeat protein [Pedobacter nanyangensis]
MKRTLLYIFIWMLPLLADSSVFAQDFNVHVNKILQCNWPQNKKIDSLYQWGSNYYYRDYVFFHQLADTLLNLSEKANYPLGKSRSHILLGFISNGQGDLEGLQQHAQKALSYISPKKPSNELVWVLYCKGSYFRRKKRDKEAMEVFYKGLTMAQALGNKTAEAAFNNLIGIMHVGRREYHKALSYYERTLELAKAINDSTRIQRTYTNKGIVYQRQHKYAEAIQAHQQALKIAKELGNETDQAFAYNDLGATYIEVNNGLHKAIAYLKKSIAIREKLKEDSEIAYSYGYLGMAYGKIGNKREAVGNLKKALAIAITIGNNKQHYEALEELANQYSHFKQNDSAYHYLRAYTVFRDSLRKAEEQEAIAELTVRHETEKKEQEIAILTQKNKIQQLGIGQRNLYLSMALLLVLCTLVTLWHLYRTKKAKEQQLKQEAILQAELLQLEAKNSLQNDRLRISKDLHDNIGANLTFIQTSIAETDPTPEELQHVKDLVANTIAELRRTVWLINKPSVRLDEWLVKLREYYRKVKKVEIATKSSDENLFLTSRQATLIFRIIQEAVNNSLKHAMPDHIAILVWANLEKMEVNISDDGKGFEKFANRQGFGLENMRQNAEELDGSFHIESSTGKGTKIIVSFHFIANTQ